MTAPRLPDPREKPWLTVAELAALTGEGEKAIRAALRAGQLPLLQVGRYWRIPTAALWQLLGIELSDAMTSENSEARSATDQATATVHALAKSSEHHYARPAS